MRQFYAIWKIMEGFRGPYGKAILALVLASCFLYLIPLVPQAILDGALASPDKQPTALVQTLVSWMGGRVWLREHLWVGALVIAVLATVAGYLTYLRGRWSADASESVIRRLRDRLYDHIQRLPIGYFDKAETGDLIQRCTSDVETLRVFLSTHVVEIGRALIMLLVPIPLMLAISPAMTLASVVLLPIIVLFSWFFFVRVKHVFQAKDEAESHLTSRLQENLSGIRVVRAFARQDFEAQLFEKSNASYRASDYQLYVLLSRFWATSDLLCFGQMGVVTGVGLVLLSKGLIGVGAFYFFLAAVNLFLWPMRMMGRILADLGKAMVAVERLSEILEAPTEAMLHPPSQVIAPAVSDVSEVGSETAKVASMEQALPVKIESPLASAQPGAANAVSAQGAALSGVVHEQEQERQEVMPVRRPLGDLVFSDVSFGYGDIPAVKGLSFVLKPGDTLGLVGPSGSGKSTILRLLLRLYEPDSGQITLGDVPLSAYSQQEVRGWMAAVLQNSFLFSRQIGRNIKMGRADATDEARDEAAKMAQIHESILSFEAGYETICGERGVTLSGGQRQRLSIARALVQEPSFLLLDDAMSAVDTETEQGILDALRQRHGQQTTIMSAHRLSSVMHADQILVLHAGEIVQSGDHASLLQKDGWYRDLWSLQSSIEDEDDDEGAQKILDAA